MRQNNEKTPYEIAVARDTTATRWDSYGAFHVPYRENVVFFQTGEVAIMGTPDPYDRKRYSEFGFSLCDTGDTCWDFFEPEEDTKKLITYVGEGDTDFKPVPIPRAQINKETDMQYLLVCNATGRAKALERNRSEEEGVPNHLFFASAYMNPRAVTPHGAPVKRARPLLRGDLLKRKEWLAEVHKQMVAEIVLLDTATRSGLVGTAYAPESTQMWGYSRGSGQANIVVAMRNLEQYDPRKYASDALATAKSDLTRSYASVAVVRTLASLPDSDKVVQVRDAVPCDHVLAYEKV